MTSQISSHSSEVYKGVHTTVNLGVDDDGCPVTSNQRG